MNLTYICEFLFFIIFLVLFKYVSFWLKDYKIGEELSHRSLLILKLGKNEKCLMANES